MIVVRAAIALIAIGAINARADSVSDMAECKCAVERQHYNVAVALCGKAVESAATEMDKAVAKALRSSAQAKSQDFQERIPMDPGIIVAPSERRMPDEA